MLYCQIRTAMIQQLGNAPGVKSTCEAETRIHAGREKVGHDVGHKNKNNICKTIFRKHT